MTKQDQQRAERILAFIRETVAERGYPPSVREIAEAVGLASTSAVHHHLTKLEKEGRLNKEATRSRALSLPGMSGGRMVQAPIVGEIAAGQPIHAYEDRSETIGLPTVLARVNEYRARFGDYWEPAPLLERLVAEGRGFYGEPALA